MLVLKTDMLKLERRNNYGIYNTVFIRKSTYKLRKKLDELDIDCLGRNLNEDLCIFTSPECGLYNIEFLITFHILMKPIVLDCGTNEELFHISCIER